MDKRTILAVVLSLAVLFLYQTFFVKPQPPQKSAAPQQSVGSIKKDNASTTASTPEKATVAEKTATDLEPVKPEATPRDILVDTPHYTAVFSTRGAALKSMKLKDYSQDCYKCTDDLWPKIKRLFTGSKDPLKPKTKDFV